MKRVFGYWHKGGGRGLKSKVDVYKHHRSFRHILLRTILYIAIHRYNDPIKCAKRVKSETDKQVISRCHYLLLEEVLEEVLHEVLRVV